jgi:Oxidoreductase family, NAD-binding Rossmann fold
LPVEEQDDLTWRYSLKMPLRRTVWLFVLAASSFGATLRLGIIGTDTSHSIAFARVLNDENDKNHVPGARITAAWKGGSPDIEQSTSRVEKFSSELKEKWGVKFVDSISQLCQESDGLLVESIDGRLHLDQFRQAAECGKPIFVDKPLASTLADAREIARLAASKGIRWFSASSLRFSPITGLKSADTTSAIVWAPGPLEKHHALDLSWYGIHGVEMLYTVLGQGCVEVSRVSTADTDVVTGKWRDGRMGTVHLQRPYGKYGGIAYLKDQKINAMPDVAFNYADLVREIVKFMESKTPPVANAETLEMFGFMDAAQRSLGQNGALVKLDVQ